MYEERVKEENKFWLLVWSILFGAVVAIVAIVAIYFGLQYRNADWLRDDQYARCMTLVQRGQATSTNCIEIIK